MSNWLSAAKRRLLGDPLNDAAPPGFVTQELEPTGGKIFRPRDWFYSEGHRGPTLLWTISREDSRWGSYVTGLRIQVFSDIQAGTGKTPSQFIHDIAESKYSGECKILRTFPEVDQGLFCRIGIETEEVGNRIVYSLFWAKDQVDVAAISIAGTTTELWDLYAPTFQVMAEFELLDRSRFQ